MDDVFTQEVSMTAEEFAEAVDKLISAAREGGFVRRENDRGARGYCRRVG
jgi:hypothetical protein